MKRYDNIFATCILSSALALAVSAVGTQAWAEPVDRLMGLVEPLSASKPLTIGAALVHLQDDYWKGIAYGIFDEAKLSGVTVEQIDIAGGYGNVPQQFAQIESMVSKGIQTLIVAPVAYDGFNQILGRLKSQNINILVAGVPVNSASADFGIVQSDVEIGSSLTKIVCDDKGEKTAKAIVIQGPAGAEWARIRVDAVRKAAAECPGLEVVVGPIGREISLAYGLSQASDMMLTNPDANYIITIETSIGLGATQAVRNAGTEVKVVTSALDKRAVDEIEKGNILLGSTTEPGILIGRLLVQYAIRQNEGIELKGVNKLADYQYPVMVVPAFVFSRETMAQHPSEVYDIPPEGWNLNALQ